MCLTRHEVRQALRLVCRRAIDIIDRLPAGAPSVDGWRRPGPLARYDLIELLAAAAVEIEAEQPDGRWADGQRVTIVARLAGECEPFARHWQAEDLGTKPEIQRALTWTLEAMETRAEQEGEDATVPFRPAS